MNTMENNIYLSVKGENASLLDAEFLIINDVKKFISDCENQNIIDDGVKTTGFYRWDNKLDMWNTNLSTTEIEFIKKHLIESADFKKEKVTSKENSIKMKIKEIIDVKYQTEDGKVFATYDEAKDYIKNTDSLLKARKIIAEYCNNISEKNESCELCPFSQNYSGCYKCSLLDCESPLEWLF